MLSFRSVLLLSTLTAVLGGVAGAGTSLLLRPAAGKLANATAAVAPNASASAFGRERGAAADPGSRSADADADADGIEGGIGDDPSIVGAGDGPDSVQPTTIRELAAALDEATAERSQLAATLVDLSRDIEVLEQAIGAFNLPGGEAMAELASNSVSLGESGAGQRQGQAGGRARNGRNGLDADGLVAAGVDPQVSAELERRSDAWQLARLELVDRASREGWEGSGELDEQLEQLDDQRPDLREELGDDRYDAYLFAAGRPNRVAVASVIPGSVAEAAGLQPDDVLTSYAGERVFDVRSLQRATRAGSLGEGVSVQVQRDGQPLQVQVTRGPLGVSLAPVRREP